MLYAFDEVTEALELLPIAARRALDHAGRRLSRAAWTSLSVERRRRIVALGATRGVDAEAVREAVGSARPPAEEIPPTADPASEVVPEDHGDGSRPR